MKVKQELLLIAKSIKEKCPQLPQQTKTNLENYRYSFINNFQKYLAEMCFIIDRECQDDALDSEFAVAYAKHPQKLKFIIDAFKGLSAAIIHKLNFAESQQFFDKTFCDTLRSICVSCYYLKEKLEGSVNITGAELNRGLAISYEYTDYQSSFKRIINKGSQPGQAIPLVVADATTGFAYDAKINEVRLKLDSTFDLSESQSISISSNSPEFSRKNDQRSAAALAKLKSTAAATPVETAQTTKPQPPAVVASKKDDTPLPFFSGFLIKKKPATPATHNTETSDAKSDKEGNHIPNNDQISSRQSSYSASKP